MSPEPFPWWLWLLAGLWSVTLTAWQRCPFGREGQPFLTTVLVVYTALLALSAANGFAAWSIGRATFWLCGGLAVAGALCLLNDVSARARSVAPWLLGIGVAGLFVQWGRVELAGAAFVLIGFVAYLRGQRSVVADASRPYSIVGADVGLIAVAAMLTVVGWIGSARHAVLVEMQRSTPSRWMTVFPAREQVQRWKSPDHAIREWTSFWEPLALATVLSVLVLSRPRNEARSA